MSVIPNTEGDCDEVSTYRDLKTQHRRYGMVGQMTR
jgi:hypothetical protein